MGTIIRIDPVCEQDKRCCAHCELTDCESRCMYADGQGDCEMECVEEEEDG